LSQKDDKKGAGGDCENVKIDTNATGVNKFLQFGQGWRGERSVNMVQSC